MSFLGLFVKRLVSAVHCIGRIFKGAASSSLICSPRSCLLPPTSRILEHDIVQQQARHQAFLLGVLILKLFELSDLVRFQSLMPVLPPVERLSTIPRWADKVGDWCPHLCLLEHRHNLLDRESFSFHGILLPHRMANYYSNCTY
jgi:hypothetical protein